jgi:hypothetical protein
VANVNLPVPVLVAGGSLCLLAGFLLGTVAGPSSPDRATGTVTSYDSGTGRLCLEGDAVADQEGADDEGLLCGLWRRSAGARTPHSGDSFRFVTVLTATAPEGTETDQDQRVLIYGDVVD